LDSGEEDDAAAEARHHQNKIETIINQKSKSIADVLLSDGLNNFYGNFLQQHMHPFAKKHRDPKGNAGKADPQRVGRQIENQLVDGARVEGFKHGADQQW